MKAVLSNRIFIEADRELRESLSKELTYKIPPQNPNDPPQIIKNLQRVRENLVSVPIGREDLIPNAYEIIDKRVVVPVDFPDFKLYFASLNKPSMTSSIIAVSSMRG